MEELRIVLLISAIVLFIIVFYRWLLKYLHRKEIGVKFTYLFPFEREVFMGKEKLKLDLPESNHVRAEILTTTNGELVLLAFEGILKQGICEMDIDFDQVQKGEYNLKIILPDQIITRYIRVDREVY